MCPNIIILLMSNVGVFDEWALKGTGPLATNGIDAGVKIRPTEEELKEMAIFLTQYVGFPRGAGLNGVVGKVAGKRKKAAERKKAAQRNRAEQKKLPAQQKARATS